jgi:hypothetical protein
MGRTTVPMGRYRGSMIGRFRVSLRYAGFCMSARGGLHELFIFLRRVTVITERIDTASLAAHIG